MSRWATYKLISLFRILCCVFWTLATVLSGTFAQYVLDQRVVSNDAMPFADFGLAIAFDDGTLVIGAPSRQDAPGACYVFAHDGSKWQQQQKLVASVGAPGDYFGAAVAIDGGTIVVGARGGDAAYVFVQNNTVWQLQQKLTAGLDAKNALGISVAIEGDTVIVGAIREAFGAAFVFVRSGTQWKEQATLTAPNTALFGMSVALAGSLALIGAHYEVDQQGAAYLITRQGASSWSHTKRLVAGDGKASSHFGNRVALSSDGTYALVGAPRAGKVYMFGGPSWEEQMRFQGGVGIFESSDTFGAALAVDGDRFLIGSFNGTYLCRLVSSSGVDLQEKFEDEVAVDSGFGGAVAFADEGKILVGAWKSEERGAVFSFEAPASIIAYTASSRAASTTKADLEVMLSSTSRTASTVTVAMASMISEVTTKEASAVSGDEALSSLVTPVTIAAALAVLLLLAVACCCLLVCRKRSTTRRRGRGGVGSGAGTGAGVAGGRRSSVALSRPHSRRASSKYYGVPQLQPHAYDAAPAMSRASAQYEHGPLSAPSRSSVKYARGSISLPYSPMPPRPPTASSYSPMPPRSTDASSYSPMPPRSTDSSSYSPMPPRSTDCSSYSPMPLSRPAASSSTTDMPQRPGAPYDSVQSASSPHESDYSPMPQRPGGAQYDAARRAFSQGSGGESEYSSTPFVSQYDDPN